SSKTSTVQIKRIKPSIIYRLLLIGLGSPMVIYGLVRPLTIETMEEALELANDTQYGLGAGVWSRNGNLAYKMGRGIQAGRVWTNCYHAYPAHAAFGGYKQSGIGRETHKMMLEHYQQTKCLLVS
ncbi:aldehyde dehydrogenase family protein, partial [Escherichia sp. R-CC3]